MYWKLVFFFQSQTIFFIQSGRFFLLLEHVNIQYSWITDKQHIVNYRI
jgi:hypothetical protein